jgi:hypothetical protein
VPEQFFLFLPLHKTLVPALAWPWLLGITRIIAVFSAVGCKKKKT